MVEHPGIGGLNESSLHRSLKEYVAAPGDRFEVEVDGFVIDIVRGDLLIEIQTTRLASMAAKLERLLVSHDIRIVVPLAQIRRLEQPGRPPRRSPISAGRWNIFDHLVGLPTLVDNPRLDLLTLVVEETELRSGHEMVRRGRRGRTLDRRLDAVLEEHVITSTDDLVRVLPDDLDEPFTTADLAARAGLKRPLAQRACYVLRHNGAIEQVGRDRAGVRYRRSNVGPSETAR